MIVITGNSRGIGKFLQTEYEERGERVYGTHNADGKRLFDLQFEDGARDFVKSLPVNQKEITLFNCAGSSKSAFLHKVDTDEWIDSFAMNIAPLVLVTKLLLVRMREAGHGRIINFGSVVPQMGVAGTTAYAAAKAAIWGFSKSLSKEVSRADITVNTINLGYFDIGMISEVPKAHLEKIVNSIPAGRLGRPEEIFNTVEYIRSTPYLNGAEINLNGGLF